MADDYDEFLDVIREEAAKPVASLSELMALARRAVDLEATVKDLEEALKHQKGALNDIKTKLLPDAMASVGQTKFTADDGSEISIEDFVAGSLPKDPLKRQAALLELETNGGDGIIKNEIVLEFEKKQHNEALALAEELHDRGYDAKVKSNVHPQTLMAFVREKLRNGEKVEAEKLGCFVGRVAKIKLVKSND